MTRTKTGAPGTTDQRPRWEGPPENRPRGYLPPVDDPKRNPDALGETVEDDTPSDKRKRDKASGREQSS